jgi:alpha-beta hydrolase superfamily lysophospholipase
MPTLDERVLGADGETIYRCAWLPETEPRAQLTLLHGYAEHCQRYEHFVGLLNDAGIAVFALDHKGHGHSQGRRAYITNFKSLVPDAVSTLRWAAEQVPEVPRLLFGHSMGGALAALLAIEHADLFDYLILSAPAVKVSEDISPLLQKVSGIISAIAPILPVTWLDNELLCRDSEVVAAYEADPLVYTGGVLARTGHSLLSTQALVLGRGAAIEKPTLILHGSADGLVEPSGSQTLFERLSSEDKTLKTYDGFYHELLNEPDRERVLGDVFDWLNKRLGSA